MYYSGELNVPGAAGNIHNYNPNAQIPPATVFQPNMNTTGAPVGYSQQATGFMNLPGAIGNVQGMEIAGNPSFDINESAAGKRIRGIRRLGEKGVGGEKDAALNLLKRLGGPQLPPV